MLPFPALVGRDLAQQALLLLAIAPELRGVVFAAPAGTGKSTLARGVHALLGDVPFVELPLHADEEALLGGVDLDIALRTGKRVVHPGLLARAHGGVLYADNLNLLPDSTVNALLAAVDTGRVQVEREELSSTSPADFILIGTYDPAERQPRAHLLDRVGLLVPLAPHATAAQRAEVVRRNLTPLTRKEKGERRNEKTTTHPPTSTSSQEEARSSITPSPSRIRGQGGEVDDWDTELEALQALVLTARSLYPYVNVTDEQITTLTTFALACGVAGHRVDLFAEAAVRASAALALRDEVEVADLELAAKVVILPRATRTPEPPPTEQPAPPPSQETLPLDDEESKQESNDQNSVSDEVTPPQDEVFAALATALPEALLTLPFRALRRGKSGSRGATLGNRGRHIRSVPGDPRRARLDVAATIRAALPNKNLRPASAHNKTPIRMSDVRVKLRRSKAGALFCFIVDASGSMALHRMRQAKGAVNALLQRAYIHRDKVALIAFRGQGATLLMRPSQSVELARRALDVLPTGGGTPLAAALLAGVEVAQQAKSRGIHQTVLVILTDGRANIGLRAEGNTAIRTELQQVGAHLRDSGMQSVVVDTQKSYLSRGEARQLAEWLGGTYAYLPNASGEQVAALVNP